MLIFGMQADSLVSIVTRFVAAKQPSPQFIGISSASAFDAKTSVATFTFLSPCRCFGYLMQPLDALKIGSDFVS